MTQHQSRLHRKGVTRDKFTVDIKDMDFKEAEKRILANHTPLDTTLNTARRSPARKFIDFLFAFGTLRAPKGR